jgi:O-antigen/teichoic acid export membrane protein
LTRIATPEIIGTSSTIISLANIFTTVAILGLPTGVSRFLAKLFFEKNLEKANMFVKASLILLALGISISIAVLLIIGDWIYFNLDPFLMTFSMLLVSSSAITILNRSIIIATLKTKILPKVMVVTASTRTVLVIILVLMHAGALGVVMGYTSFQILAAILLGFAVFRALRSRDRNNSNIKLNYPFKSILSASIPNWIPKLITTLGGSNLGTIVVFGFNGPSEAASFFLANAIFLAISAIVTPLFTIAYPTLSAMSDGRKRFAWRIIKISIILSLPLSASIIFYSNDVVLLLGHEYIDASVPLRIFLLSILPNSLYTVITELVYAYGNYRQVLALGLASSIPRTVLYFLLVPAFGATGAATSYLVGSIIGCVFAMIVAKKIGMIINWKDLGFIVIIAFLPPFISNYFQLNYILGIFSTVAISVILFLKFKILTKPDIEDAINVLPIGMAKPLTIVFNKVGKVLNRDY